MTHLAVVGIALALSMDAFAVSVTSGLAIHRLKVENALKIALFFGAFQALMPIVGWLCGYAVREKLAVFDHWIAFILLAAVGIKMLMESRSLGAEASRGDPLNVYLLLMLAIATSIDALAVGLSLSFIKIVVYTPALIIGAITFGVSFAGVYIGNKTGHFFEKKMEVAGGLILIAIGIKIVVEHLVKQGGVR
jgi:putative Mn2+ efflux pump MntP